MRTKTSAVVKPAPAVSKAWNPVEEPWRLTRYHSAPSGSPWYGWRTVVRVFATREEAEAEAAKPTTAHTLKLEYAERATEWMKRGRWSRVWSRNVK